MCGGNTRAEEVGIRRKTVTIEQYLFFKVIVFIIVLIFALIWWIKERR